MAVAVFRDSFGMDTFKDFAVAAAKYDLPCATKGNAMYYALGLCGEVSEVVNEFMYSSQSWWEPGPAIKELGDVLWYVARLGCWLDASPGCLWPREHVVGARTREAVYFNLLAMVVAAGNVAERVKKHARNGAPVDRVIVDEQLLRVLHCVGWLAGFCGVSLRRVAELNVEKLEARLSRETIFGAGDDR